MIVYPHAVRHARQRGGDDGDRDRDRGERGARDGRDGERRGGAGRDLDDGDGGARDAADERELADERDGRDVVRAARGEWGEFVFILLVVHAAISVDTRVARGRGGDVRAFDFRARARERVRLERVPVVARAGLPRDRPRARAARHDAFRRHRVRARFRRHRVRASSPRIARRRRVRNARDVRAHARARVRSSHAPRVAECGARLHRVKTQRDERPRRTRARTPRRKRLEWRGRTSSSPPRA